MNREWWMLVRAYWPTVALFGWAFLMTVTLGSLRNSSLVTGVFGVLYWAPVTLIGGAFLLFSAASYLLVALEARARTVVYDVCRPNWARA